MKSIDDILESTFRSLRLAAMIDARKLHVLFRRRGKSDEVIGRPVEFPAFASQRSQAAKIASMNIAEKPIVEYVDTIRFVAEANTPVLDIRKVPPEAPANANLDVTPQIHQELVPIVPHADASVQNSVLVFNCIN